MSALYGIALNVVVALEQITGMPMVMVSQTTDTAVHRDETAAALCERTGHTFCGEDLQQLHFGSSATGWSTIFQYESENGELHSACVIMPPADYLTPSHTSYELSAGNYFSYADQPSDEENKAFMLMRWAAHCLDQQGNAAEEKRADAFAAMAIALAQGDPIFTRYPKDTPARKFAFIRNEATTGAAVDRAERHMLEIWKREAARKVSAEGCPATPRGSSNPNVSSIKRDSTLPPCFQHHRENYALPGGIAGTRWADSFYSLGNVQVTDANLHLWMYGESSNEILRKKQAGQPENPVVGAPPQPWTPFKGFNSTQDAVRFMWSTASSISGL